MAEEVWARVANRLKWAPTPYIITVDDIDSEDKEAPPTRKKHGLKSGKGLELQTL